MSSIPEQIHSKGFSLLGSLRAMHQRLRAQKTNLATHELEPARSQVICIASGKGGTGKTFVACNLAVLLAQNGLNVSLIDADLGLANAHLLLGVKPTYDISDLLYGDKPLEEIIVRSADRLSLVPGGSGKAELTALSDADLSNLADRLYQLESMSDIILIDLSAGINPLVLKFLNVAHDIILVTNHESTAQLDTIGTIRALVETLENVTIHLVINRARDRDHAVVSFQQIWRTANRLWGKRVKLFFSGWLPNNWYVQSSVIIGKPLVVKHPRSLPTRCLETIGAKIHKHHIVWRRQQVGRWCVPSAFSKLKHITSG